MRSSAIALVLTTFLANYAVADQLIRIENGLTYAIPKGSPAAFAKRGDYTTAFFDGQFRLSGKYFYSRLPSISNEDIEDPGIRLYFIPDRKTRMKLPYWVQRGHVKEIWFTNNADFIHDVIPPSVITSIGTSGRVASGRVTIVVDSYQASVECDTPSYAVRYIAVNALQSTHITQAGELPDGC